MTGYRTSIFNFRSLILYSLGVLALLILLGYVVFQARFLIAGPEITLIDEPERVQNQRIIRLTGNTSNITKITLNDRQIFTDEHGYFDEALVLENGYTIATIMVMDRYGREARVVRSFIYTPELFVKQ